jgi:hypothetical protein
MLRAGGLDKLNLEVPKTVPFQADFGRAWKDPNNDKIFKKTTGGMYLVAGDLRGVGIPARISIGHKYHEKLGPKIEILGAGEMTYSQWREVPEQIFAVDSDEAGILRVDLAADVEGVGVPEFGTAMWCKFKHTAQQEFGEYQHLMRRYERFGAQSLYYGRGEDQFKAYNKTLQCEKVLLPKIHKRERAEQCELSTFEEAFGFPRDLILTRVERRLGDRGTTKNWGISNFGEIQRLAKVDPYERLEFAADTNQDRLRNLSGAALSHVLRLRAQIAMDGVDVTKAELRECFGDRSRAFRKFWQEHAGYLIDSNPLVSREMLTSQYRRSFSLQMAA